MSKFYIHSLNISEKKGIKKDPVKTVTLKKSLGILEDAHKGVKNREISFLSREEIDNFRSDLVNGSFGENITTKGLDISELKLLDKIYIGKNVLQVSKIGKQCHDRCHIYHSVGDCIMPKKGVFAKVLKSSGKIKNGDECIHEPKVFNVGVITLSDRAYKGEYADKSGPLIEEILQKHYERIGRQVFFDRIVIPDSKSRLKQFLKKFLKKDYDIVVTTGGTGVSKRDITIEVVQKIISRELPGVTEHIRTKYGQQIPNALLSRSIVGVKDNTVIACLPGSVKAVKEYMEEILKILDHTFYMLYDVDAH